MGTHIHTDRHTDRHTDIHKGNNNEIKYAKDITAIKNNALLARLNEIRLSLKQIGFKKCKIQQFGRFKQTILQQFVTVQFHFAKLLMLMCIPNT